MENPNALVGFFNLNKPSGITSAAAVNRIKRIAGQRGLGHMGTLDPMADGVLVVAAGRRATRMFDALQAKEKEYLAEFVFGFDTDTLDTTGAVTNTGGGIPSEAEIAAAVKTMTGRVEQIPPRYSAKSVNGERAYDLARRGADFELKPKTVDIRAFEFLGRVSGRDAFGFKIVCGGGTYIRAMARDLGVKLNTFCVMSALTRTRSGRFRIEDAATFADLERDYRRYLVPVEDAL